MADDQDLDKLRATYKKLQDEIAALQEKAATTQALLKTTEAQLAEIAKATDGYDKSGVDMQHELDDGQKTIAKKRSTAEFKIKDLKDTIDKKIVDFDAALTDQAKAVAAAAQAATNASAAADQAAQTLRDKQSAFATAKNEPKALAAKLQELDALVAAITKAEVDDDATAMYFYISEATAVAKDISVPTPDDYKKQLVAAQSAVEDAKTAVAATKADSDKTAAATADAKKAYDAARGTRRSDLLKALRDVKAPPPP
jgi:DNA repair exonuclease SbcCD ATPase subunit